MAEWRNGGHKKAPLSEETLGLGVPESITSTVPLYCNIAQIVKSRVILFRQSLVFDPYL